MLRSSPHPTQSGGAVVAEWVLRKRCGAPAAMVLPRPTRRYPVVHARWPLLSAYR